MKGCPLTAVFGKDVANLIYHYVWRSNMTIVCKEYENKVMGHDFFIHVQMKEKVGWRFVNFRRYGEKPDIWNLNQSWKPVRQLSPNYW